MSPCRTNGWTPWTRQRGHGVIACGASGWAACGGLGGQDQTLERPLLEYDRTSISRARTSAYSQIRTQQPVTHVDRLDEGEHLRETIVRARFELGELGMHQSRANRPQYRLFYLYPYGSPCPTLPIERKEGRLGTEVIRHRRDLMRTAAAVVAVGLLGKGEMS